MRSLRRKSVLKWNGCPVRKCHDSKLISGKAQFYNSVIIKNSNYSVDDFVLANAHDNSRVEKIYQLKYLYEENEIKKAVVSIYDWAVKYRDYFSTLNIDFDEKNEVVLDGSKEVALCLTQINTKCRVIFGVTDDTVAETIDDKNLNRQYYFLCRFRYSKKSGVRPILQHDTDDEVSSSDTECETPNKTPSQKIDKNGATPCNKKIESETKLLRSGKRSILVDNVKRNLNKSFNDSLSQDDSLLNYSIVEKQEEDLKLKLRVSKKQILKDQPLVLLERVDSEMSRFKGETQETPRCETPKTKYNFRNSTNRKKDISDMVYDLTINDRSTIKASPRKLRRLSRPLYSETFSDSESENFTNKRKSTRNKVEETIESDMSISFKRKSEMRKLEFEIEPKRVANLKNETPKSVKKGTPLKLLREGLLTPTIDQRRKSVAKANTPLVMARSNLHVSYVPSMLPCRETEYADIYDFLEGKLEDECGGCMYVSGVPGTGKTATVTAAINNLMIDWKKKGNDPFNFISVNGMKLTEPRQCYVEILKQLTGKRVSWEQALTQLEQKFTAKSKTKVTPTVLLVDELDILCTKRQDVVYNLLDWPTKSKAQLIIITIANTMDLPERLLMSRVASRLGLTRLTFQAYTYKQLQEIVANRLTGNNSFKSDAVQFVARKVASVSGDARRALDICRRSAEIAENEGPHTQVTMDHVNAALNSMITQPKVVAIKHCNKLEQLVMKSVASEVERTGMEETCFVDCYTVLISLAALEGFKMVSMSQMASAIYKLNSCRLLLADQKCNDFNRKIILNVSTDDVYYALSENF